MNTGSNPGLLLIKSLSCPPTDDDDDDDDDPPSATLANRDCSEERMLLGLAFIPAAVDQSISLKCLASRWSWQPDWKWSVSTASWTARANTADLTVAMVWVVLEW